MSEVEIQCGEISLRGLLEVPKTANVCVIFAHGSGSGRLSPRNQHVAKLLQKGGIATLLCDLLTEEEEAIDEVTRQLRFDIDLLADRLIDVTHWVAQQPELKNLSIGYFGASTGAAAALIASTKCRNVTSVVSRGGRPDLAAKALPRVTAPTLLIVGGADFGVIELNEQAYNMLTCEKSLQIVPNATHLFEEPGTLDMVAKLALDWFKSPGTSAKTE